MTLTRHRLPADTVVLELKMLPSVVCSVVVVVDAGSVVLAWVDAGTVTLLLVGGVCVDGVFLMEKERDWVPHSFRVKTIVRFSPAGRRGVIIIMVSFHVHQPEK